MPAPVLDPRELTLYRKWWGRRRVGTVVAGVLAVIAVACGDSEPGRMSYPRGAPPSMAELDCARSDGENSTTVDRPTDGGLAADPEAAVDEFATTGFIDLDDPAGVLEVVRRDSSRARAEYRVGDETRAILLVATDGGWWVNAVAWCSEMESTTSS